MSIRKPRPITQIRQLILELRDRAYSLYASLDEIERRWLEAINATKAVPDRKARAQFGEKPRRAPRKRKK